MASFPGQLHIYKPRSDQSNGLVAFEHPSPHESPKNVVLFATGLTEGLLTVSYPRELASKLPKGWSLAEVLLSSAYNGWGTSSLARDASELAEAVTYFRQTKGRQSKIVILGHSTGCQDCMEYCVGPGADERPHVDGIILQAPVSDPEAAAHLVDPAELKRANETAQEMVKNGQENDVMPNHLTRGFFNGAVTAYRWLSLLSPDGKGDDDYFSSYLSDEQLQKSFGRLGEKRTKLGIFYSGADESMPQTFDKDGLVKRWTKVTEEGKGEVDPASGVVPNANHNYEGKDAATRNDLYRRVCGFLERIPSGQ